MPQDQYSQSELDNIVARETRMARLEERQIVTKEQMNIMSEAQVKSFTELKADLRTLGVQLTTYESEMRDKFVTHDDLKSAIRSIKQWISLPIIGGMAVFMAIQYVLVTGTYTDKLITSYIENKEQGYGRTTSTIKENTIESPPIDKR